MYEDSNFNSDFDDDLSDLMSLLSNIPKNTATILNIARYKDAAQSICQIIKLVKEDFPDAKASVSFDDFTGTTLILTIIADGVNIYSTKEFCSALSTAATMDIVPVGDDKIQIGFTYKNIKSAITPSSHN